ncbi:hypothetical protein KJR09_02765 [Streptococcus lutetiensis]|uniref:DUF6287 domain-containing protein n=1 Tax=Streptococcus lutetiensis TaxID=150055 RepID=UPI001BDB4AEB|nr:DUF6287 domain-containing protein [Streptococcus lutetiensis]MBT0910456.1 hypothetical protein [Streptococcus lutetiensis]
MCGGVLAFNQHSQYKQTSATTTHLRRSTRGKSTSSSAKKKEVYKRHDLFQLPNEKKITNNLVKDGKNIVDSRQVSKEASHFDFAALAQGDFSSLAGTWQDANGFTFEFSPEGIVSENGRLTLSDLAYDDKGEAISQVSSQRDGGFILYYYAAGNQNLQNDETTTDEQAFDTQENTQSDVTTEK